MMIWLIPNLFNPQTLRLGPFRIRRHQAESLFRDRAPRPSALTRLKAPIAITPPSFEGLGCPPHPVYIKFNRLYLNLSINGYNLV